MTDENIAKLSDQNIATKMTNENIATTEMNDEKPNLLNNKRKPDSNGKEVLLVDFDENGKEKTISENIFKTNKELSHFLSYLENPFYFHNGEIIDLSTKKNISNFYYNKAATKIYEKKENIDLLNEYKLVFQEVIDESKENYYKLEYPLNINRICFSPKFFLNLPEIKFPKFYGVEDMKQMELSNFFRFNEFKVFHLFTRKKCGTTLFIMKMMHRRKEYFIYYDIRKLKEIMSINPNENNKKILLLKEFIYYSLFYIHGFYISLENGYKKIENYFYYIWSKIFNDYSSQNINVFIKSLLESYISLTNDNIVKLLNIEKEEEYQTIIIIIDHYSNEMEVNYFEKIVKDNPKIRFLIVNSIHNKKDIQNFFSYFDNDNFDLYNDSFSTSGIEVYKNKTMVGYYTEMTELSKEIFNDKDIKILNLYKKELLENFGLNNPNYYYKFLIFMNDKKKDEKDLILFNKFIKNIEFEIENDFIIFYNYNISDENYFISKYLD